MLQVLGCGIVIRLSVLLVVRVLLHGVVDLSVCRLL
jgi:hypothetical protein